MMGLKNWLFEIKIWEKNKNFLEILLNIKTIYKHINDTLLAYNQTGLYLLIYNKRYTSIYTTRSGPLYFILLCFRTFFIVKTVFFMLGCSIVFHELCYKI